jgi:hypothetical protein
MEGYGEQSVPFRRRVDGMTGNGDASRQEKEKKWCQVILYSALHQKLRYLFFNDFFFQNNGVIGCCEKLSLMRRLVWF